MDYVFCVRSISKGAFTGEPGATHFLEVPGNTKLVNPSHKIAKTKWVAKVLEMAKRGVNNGIDTGDVVFFVHGFNVTPEEMLERHRKIKNGLERNGFDGVVVSFDWPSAGSALNYLEDRKDAKFTALKLVDEGISTFAALQRPDCQINLHIVAHSMGSYVVREAFDDADDRPAVAAKSWSVSQMVLVAGDLSASSLTDNNPKSSSMFRHCVRLTNYYSPLDEILTLANVKRVGVSPRVGRVGMPDTAPKKGVDIYCGAYYKEHQDRFDEGVNRSHSWYFDDPTFMQDLTMTIEGRIDRKEFGTRAKTNLGNLALKALV
ncbi:MAG: alpha/beta hydrolase [Litoreibacter sp.]